MDSLCLLEQVLGYYAKHECKHRYQLLDGTFVELNKGRIGVSKNRIDWEYYHMKDCLLSYHTLYVTLQPKVWTPLFTI